MQMDGFLTLKGGNVELVGAPETIFVLPIGHVVSSKGEFDVDDESYKAMKAQIAKRGVELECVHFFSYPYTSELAKDKVLELARLMTRYCGRMTVNIVGFTEIQEAIRDNCPEEFFTLVMRRFMMKIAERIARDHGCGFLVTGENLGQVASQTMEAMAVTGACVDLPIFQPLIGMDKEEIVRLSRKIGTFDTSILPYEDCCTVFTPRHPRTKPNLDEVREAEAVLDIEGLIDRAMTNREFVRIKF